MRNLGLICFGILGCFLFALQPAQGVAVMSIDLGSEWMKIAVAAVIYNLVQTDRNC